MIKEKSHTWAKISQGLGVVFARFPLLPNVYTWLTLPVAVIAMPGIILQ